MIDYGNVSLVFCEVKCGKKVVVRDLYGERLYHIGKYRLVNILKAVFGKLVCINEVILYRSIYEINLSFSVFVFGDEGIIFVITCDNLSADRQKENVSLSRKFNLILANLCIEGLFVFVGVGNSKSGKIFKFRKYRVSDREIEGGARLDFFS